MAAADAPAGRQAATRRLLRSPSRRRAGARWWSALAIALAMNGAVVAALVAASGAPSPAPPPILTVRRLPMVPPAEPPPAPSRAAGAAASSPPPAPLALPPLALPPMPAAAGAPLPPPVPLALTAPLPSLLPPIASLLPAVGTHGAEDGGDVLPPPADVPAERDGLLDVERFYPRAARARGLSGSTAVRIAIASDGRVTSVQVLESTPPGVFEAAAERLAHNLRFRPATAGGRPVATDQTTIIAWTIR